MKQDHIYDFSSSILRTNRQIGREASHVLYTENNFIRVSSSGPYHSAGTFNTGLSWNGYGVHTLATHGQAQQFSRHRMDIVMFREEIPLDEPEPQFTENCFVIAGEDLPRLCYTMILDELIRLDDLTLAIEVYSENAAALAVGESDESVNDPRMLGLLESLRGLHSLRGVHIEGSISDDLKTTLLIKMLGPPPSDLELFDQLLGQFQDATSTQEQGDQDVAFTKMKSTYDTLKDHAILRPHDWDGRTVIPAGPYNGYTVRDAQRDIQIQVWMSLAWAYLQLMDDDHVWEAREYVWLLVGQRGDPNSYWSSPPMGHKAAMAFHLDAHVHRANASMYGSFDRYYFPEVVGSLEEGLRHEPGNPTLVRELKETKEEINMYQEIEDLMQMWDRLNETDLYYW